ncbi:hypothetical protein JVT61DRAFT_13900 [Boletus reticuloceps]|uniref:Uncharacterized protein n=1 Tax=Boletus reticuloceps TaxID=495285 RepID=A0A8I2YX50_9AGAM|nr:hypothetical protein JVT61DRAFT_13900 [Boletus reticuloceps]
MRSIECSTSAYSFGKLTLVLSTGKVGVLAEEEKDFASYSAASVASCKWVNSGRDNIDPLELEVYVRLACRYPPLSNVLTMNRQSNERDIYCHPVCSIGYGQHRYRTQLSDTSKKLAAVLTSSVDLTDPKREILYLEYIKGLENRSAEFIWQWWSTGHAPA